MRHKRTQAPSPKADSQFDIARLTSMAADRARRYQFRMKLPQTSTPLVAAAVLGAMGSAFTYQGLSEHFPPSFVGAAIFFVGAVFAIRMAKRKRHAQASSARSRPGDVIGRA